MTPQTLGDRVHFICHDYHHTMSIYVLRKKKGEGLSACCIPP
jgi:hypothetical protein